MVGFWRALATPIANTRFLRLAREAGLADDDVCALSDAQGSRSVLEPELEQLGAEAEAWLRARRPQLEAADPPKRAWPFLWFLLTCSANRSTLAYQGALVGLVTVVRIVNLVTFNHLMGMLGGQYQALWLPYTRGRLWAMVATFLVTSVLQYSVSYVLRRDVGLLGCRLRAQFLFLVQRQLLHGRLHGFAGTSSVGKVATLMGSDGNSLLSTGRAWQLVMEPVSILIIVFMMLVALQWRADATFAALAPAAAYYAASSLTTKVLKRGIAGARQYRTRRLDACRAALRSVLPAKLYGAEGALLERADGERRDEARCMLRGYTAYASTACSQMFLPLVTTSIAAAFALNASDSLPPSSLFSVLAYAKMLGDAFFSWSEGMACFAVVRVACASLVTFSMGLSSPAPAASTAPAEAGAPAEGGPPPGASQPTATVPPSAAGAVELRGVQLWWPGSECAVLTVPQLCIPPGACVALAGKASSGRSSLLLGLLGELEWRGGCASTLAGADGAVAVAYCPQAPFLLQSTIRENVLFGLPEDPAKLRAALYCCGLAEAVAGLPDGLDTPLAEGGRSFSAGQRSCLGLARAAYAAIRSGGPAVLLLDECTAGLDSAAVQLLMRRLLGRGGLLDGCTRIMATSDPSLLPHFDTLVAVQDGLISDAAPNPAFSPTAAEQGSERAAEARSYRLAALAADPAFLAATSALAPAAAPSTRKLTGTGDQDQRAPNKLQAALAFKGRLLAGDRVWQRSRAVSPRALDQESLKARKGAAEWALLITTPGLVPSLLLYAGLAVFVAACVAWQLVLQDWAAMEESGTRAREVACYSLMALAVLLSYALFLAWPGLMIAGNSRNLRAALRGVLASPLAFHLANSSGSLYNRFSDDQDRCDINLFFSYLGFLTVAGGILGSLLVAAVSSPWIACGFPPLLLAFAWVRRQYLAAYSQVRRGEAASRSAVFKAGSEAAEGAVVARAYGQQRLLLTRFTDALRVNAAWNDAVPEVTAWLAFMCSNLIYCSLATLAVVLAAAVLGPGVDSMAPVLVSNVMQIAAVLLPACQTLSNLEAELTSLERVHALSRLETEEAAVRRHAGDDRRGRHWSRRWSLRHSKQRGGGQPGAGWPEGGALALEFREVTAAFDWHLDPAISAVSFLVPAGASCGVVGASGSGKTSLALALAGALPILSGRILLGGTDLACVPLRRLRAAMAVVPHEAAVLQGTLRWNVDPAGARNDAEVWEVLRLVQLAGVAGELGGIDAELDPQALKLNRSQAQLLCLARAVARDVPLLVLDDPQGGHDTAGQAAMEECVRRFVAGELGLTHRRRTCLRIAHSATAVQALDLVLVMEGGRVAEAGPPAALLQQPGSLFAAMASVGWQAAQDSASGSETSDSGEAC